MNSNEDGSGSPPETASPSIPNGTAAPQNQAGSVWDDPNYQYIPPPPSPTFALSLLEHYGLVKAPEEIPIGSPTALPVVTIDFPLELTNEEKLRLQFHAVVNAVNVIHDIIGICRVAMISEELFPRTLDFCVCFFFTQRFNRNPILGCSGCVHRFLSGDLSATLRSSVSFCTNYRLCARNC